jgi:hypothetical protein
MKDNLRAKREAAKHTEEFKVNTTISDSASTVTSTEPI